MKAHTWVCVLRENNETPAHDQAVCMVCKHAQRSYNEEGAKWVGERISTHQLPYCSHRGQIPGLDEMCSSPRPRCVALRHRVDETVRRKSPMASLRPGRPTYSMWPSLQPRLLSKWEGAVLQSALRLYEREKQWRRPPFPACEWALSNWIHWRDTTCNSLGA
jgi:hypothetical protein